MGLPLKYKVNDKINDWTIISINTCSPLKYHVKCKCGYQRILGSNKLSRIGDCIKCKKEKERNEYVGKKIGSFIIINVKNIGKKRKYFVRCNCGNELEKTLNQLNKDNGCQKCRKGYYPGLIKDGVEFIKKTGRYTWELKCHCGTIYETGRLSRTNNCGCVRVEKYLNYSKEKIGNRFGILKVIGVEKSEKHNILICKCKCGNIKRVVSGHECKQKSCGCLTKTNPNNSENHADAKFTNVEIKALRELWETKQYSAQQLSEIYGVSTNYISRIVNKHIWKHV